jgi:hypothetical protein
MFINNVDHVFYFCLESCLVRPLEIILERSLEDEAGKKEKRREEEKGEVEE